MIAIMIAVDKKRVASLMFTTQLVEKFEFL